MNPELFAILGVGVSLAGLILASQRAATRDRAAIRSEFRADFSALRGEVAGLRQDVHALAQRVARLEGAFPYLTPRRAEAGGGRDPTQ